MTNSYEENSSKKIGGWIIGGVAILAVCAAAIYLIDVDQTQEARLPNIDVDVSAESGQMPKFDVDVADVSVGSKDVNVDLPTVDVKTKTIEVEVPVVDTNVEETKLSVPTIEVEKLPKTTRRITRRVKTSGKILITKKLTAKFGCQLFLFSDITLQLFVKNLSSISKRNFDRYQLES